ncbi:hypothetical protein LPICM02_230025 [Pseudolactococcus piscium]|nr:hypothetical protein LPICM02_230025 [Lactococcus piscium]
MIVHKLCKIFLKIDAKNKFYGILIDEAIVVLRSGSGAEASSPK